MTDDISWIDHPANLRANAALLRAIAEQSLLHADYIEQLRLTLDRLTTQLRAEIERLHKVMLTGLTIKAEDEIERLTVKAAEDKRGIAIYLAEITQQRTEIERLRAEIERLKHEHR